MDPRRYCSNFKNVISKHILRIKFPRSCCEIKRPLFLLRQGGKYSALAYKTGTYDTDAGESEEYQNSECLYDKMNVYKEGFCKYLSLSTYMSSDSDTKENDVCKTTWEQLKSFRVNHKKQMILGHSLRKMFFEFKDMLADNVIDIVFLSETKLDESFPPPQFSVNGF